MTTQTLETRPLGRSGLSTRPLSLGGNVFGWTADEKTSFAVLDRFIDAGFSLVDTADGYSRWVPGHDGGESETIIGKWLKQSGKRDHVLIATKLGNEMPGVSKGGLSAAYVKSAAEASLKRLQTDYIDLYQAHVPDPNTPHEETLAAMADLIKEGKVRAIGSSNFNPAQVKDSLEAARKHGLPRYETFQPLYNLYDRDGFERQFAQLCVAEEIGVIPYYALASGFLTGKYRKEADVNAAARAHSNGKYMTERGFRILAAMDQASARIGANLAQIAVAWLIAQPAVTAPIASATSIAQLEDLLAATRLKLDAETLAALNDASA